MRWLHPPKYVSISFLFDGVTSTFLKADLTVLGEMNLTISV